MGDYKMIEKIAKLLKERVPNKTWQPKVLAEEIYNLAIENLENQLYVSRIMLRKANEKLAKAEHDAERYKKRIEELQKELKDERLN